MEPILTNEMSRRTEKTLADMARTMLRTQYVSRPVEAFAPTLRDGFLVTAGLRLVVLSAIVGLLAAVLA